MSGDKIGPGKFVSLTYSILNEAGAVLEQHDIPVSYIYGGDVELLGGMDKAVKGKRVGDTVEVTLAPDEGVGPYDPSLTFTDDIGNVPPQFRRIGAEVPMQSESGEVRTFYVTRIEEGKLTVDGNHPMAGKTLRVHVEIQEVRDATKEDAMALSNSPSSRLN
jgi:FKBP-type peptidyl-prolyl cis-trans isomerase SlyD